MTLTLSDEERKALTQLLEQGLRALLNEINHTDDHAFKVDLRARERILRDMLTRVGSGGTS